MCNIRQNGDYGFINPGKGGGGQVFVHSSQITTGEKVLRKGQILEFKVVETSNGKQAQDVRVLLNPPCVTK